MIHRSVLLFFVLLGCAAPPRRVPCEQPSELVSDSPSDVSVVAAAGGDVVWAACGQADCLVRRVTPTVEERWRAVVLPVPADFVAGVPRKVAARVDGDAVLVTATAESVQYARFVELVRLELDAGSASGTLWWAEGEMPSALVVLAAADGGLLQARNFQAVMQGTRDLGGLLSHDEALRHTGTVFFPPGETLEVAAAVPGAFAVALSFDGLSVRTFTLRWPLDGSEFVQASPVSLSAPEPLVALAVGSRAEVMAGVTVDGGLVTTSGVAPAGSFDDVAVDRALGGSVFAAHSARGVEVWFTSSDGGMRPIAELAATSRPSLSHGADPGTFWLSFQRDGVAVLRHYRCTTP